MAELIGDITYSREERKKLRNTFQGKFHNLDGLMVETEFLFGFQPKDKHYSTVTEILEIYKAEKPFSLHYPVSALQEFYAFEKLLKRIDYSACKRELGGSNR